MSRSCEHPRLVPRGEGRAIPAEALPGRAEAMTPARVANRPSATPTAPPSGSEAMAGRERTAESNGTSAGTAAARGDLADYPE